MNPTNAPPPVSLPPSPPPEALFDLAAVGQLIGITKRSMRRHPWLSVSSGLFVVAAALAAIVLLPKTYYNEAKILAQRNMVMPALGNPRRSVPAESDAPTKLAAEAVLKRDNLLGIIRETNLLVEWKAQRVPLLRLKDKIEALVTTPLTKEEELDALVGLLVQRLGVDPQEGTVTIGVRWPNAQTAHRIVQAAQDNFLAERHSTEVSLIGESIAILEGHVATTRLDIDSAYAELQALAPTRARRPAPAPVRTAPVDRELASQQALLVAKRQAIADLTSLRNQRVADLQSRLDERLRVLGPNHPEIADMRRSLATASIESPQLEDLRAEERRLVDDISRKGATPGAVEAPRALTEELMSAARDIRAGQASSAVSGAEESYATSRLKISLDNYQDLLDRLNSARIELQTARAAFKYRYSVLTPGQVPSRPVAPNAALILALGLVLGVSMSIAAPVLLDLMGGRVLESSQVRSSLGLDVLGEIGRL